MRKSTFAIALSLLSAIVWFGLQSSQPQAADEPKPQTTMPMLTTHPIQKWEYLEDNTPTPARLNERGLEGWEMCGVTSLGSQNTTIYFKRPKQ